MKNIYQLAGWLLAAVVAGLFCPSATLAQYYSNNNGSSPVIVVDKKIRLPGSDKLLDNIASTSHVFGEAEQVEFSIKVENRGNVTLTNIELTDYLPKYLNLQYFFGVKSGDGQKVTTTISQLEPGESKSFYIIAMVNNLPTSEVAKYLKETNKVCAVSTNASDCDNAAYYVTTKSMPNTGSNDLVMGTGLALGMMGVAMVGRKLIRGY